MSEIELEFGHPRPAVPPPRIKFRECGRIAKSAGYEVVAKFETKEF